MAKNASATKSGPGRYHKGGKPASRIGKARPVRAYAALMAAWASKRVTKAKHRDEHGAYTPVGGTYTIEGGTPSKSEHVMAAGVGDGEGFYTARRIWLAGISAQRGY